MAMIKATIPDEQHEKLKAEAKRIGMSVAALLRLLVYQVIRGQITVGMLPKEK